MPIEFVLDAFESSHTMDLSATLDKGDIPTTLDVSADAVFYVGKDVMESVFRFSSNSWDVNDVSADDIHYFTFVENWIDDFHVNPANAQMDKWGANNAILSIPDSPYKMLLKHDFIRYLSLKLFSTAQGVDLFNNEVALINELNRLGNEAWVDISGMLWAKNAYTDVAYVNDTDYEANNDGSTKFFLDASVNRVCTTDEFSGNQNIPRELFRQILNQRPERFNDISFAEFDVAGETVYHTAPIPFGPDDFVSFKFTINPAPGQYNLTGVPEFGARVYKINLIVKDSQNVVDWNTDPID